MGEGEEGWDDELGWEGARVGCPEVWCGRLQVWLAESEA